MKQPHITTIRNKFIGFFLISSFFPFLILGGLSLFNYQKTINSNALAYTKQLMELSASKLDDFFYKWNQYYYSIYTANFPKLLPVLGEHTLEGVRAKLSLDQSVLQLQNFYNLPSDLYVTIAESSGSVVYQNSSALINSYSYQELDWFTTFIQSNDSSTLSPPEILPYHTPISESTSYVTYAKKIRSPYSSEDYFIFLLDFPASELDDLLSPLIKGEGSSLFLLQGERILYTCENGSLLAETLQPILKSQSQNASSVQKQLQGKTYLIHFYPLSSTSLTVLSANPLSSIIAEVPNLTLFTLILFFISVALSILLACYFSERLMKPIRTLKTTTFQVIEGNLNVQIPPLSNDEIGELGLCINQMLHHIRTLIQEKYEYTLREKELQLKTLQSQINPHFLYNTLETISSIAENEGVDEISEIAVNMADLYRYSIRSSDTLVPLSEEVNHVRSYLDIMKVRYGERLDTHFHIDENILTAPIMRLTLQPIVENAIQHGLEHVRGGGILSLSIQKKGSVVLIQITDNGAGIPKDILDQLNKSLGSDALLDMTPHTKHLGIRNVYCRLKLKFGDQADFQIESTPLHGTTVRIMIPYPSSCEKEIILPEEY